MRHLLICILSPLIVSSSDIFGSVDAPEQVLVCPLSVTGDQLLSVAVGAGGIGDPLSTAQPYIVSMVVDTGAKHSLIFDPRIPSQKRSSYSISPDGNEIKFQSFVVEKRGVNTVPLSTVGCNFAAVIPQASVEMAAPLKADYGETIQGLVGLNLDAIRDKNLFITRPFGNVKSIAIKVPMVLQPGARSEATMIVKSKKFSIRGPYDGPYMHVNSHHYWSTIVTKLKMGGPRGDYDNTVIPAPPGKSIAVVFDTGSNHFGVTEGLYADVQEAIRDGKAGFVIETMAYFDTTTDSKPTPTSLKFPSDEMGNFNRDLNQGFVVEKIDQSQFDDLANYEIVVIGTRGLRGKTLSIFPNDSPAKTGEFVLSVTN